MREVLSSKVFSGVAFILVGIWMMLAVQWGLEIKGGICWMWFATMAMGAAVISLGIFSIPRK